jgi:hypothetical protein
MSHPSTPNATSESGRPAVPPQSRTLGRAEPNTVNPRNFPTRGCNASSTTTAASVSGRPAATQFNAVHSPAEYVKESADHALFKMVRYVLLRPLRPELDAKTKTCLAEGELSSRLDEQAISHYKLHLMAGLGVSS